MDREPIFFYSDDEDSDDSGDTPIGGFGGKGARCHII